MQAIAGILYTLLTLFFFLLIIRLVVGWIQIFARDWTPRGPVLVVLEVVYSITDPPIKAVRRVIPPLRLGGIALDMGLLVVFIIVWILQSILAGLAT
ncbi:YggT family protein [Nocardioidaceae bacterium]|nr:YggT family protein [Nocardioidaceae bacterium]